MKKNKVFSGLIGVLLVIGFVIAGCATIPKEPTVLEGYWRFTTTTGNAEGDAAVDKAMENVGAFLVFINGEYYKGMGVLPHEKGVFFIDGNNIEMKPTHMNTGIMQNKLNWSKIGLGLASLYSEKTIPYTLDGNILKVVEVGMQQAYRKVDQFFSFDKKGNLIFNFK
jgi:hypothetical protein